MRTHTLVGVIYIGVLQVFALFADISRDDILLATPPILAAGVLKQTSLGGAAGAHIHSQVILGVIVSFIGAYFPVRFLMRWFRARTLTPFAVYCLVFGGLSFVRFV